jgi:Mn2+/Fe2+ NRAMP family transporter
VISAFLAHPKLAELVRGTLIPTIQFNRDFLAILVGTSLSAYLYTWQSNEEVEEKIAAGKRSLRQHRGTTYAELRTSLWDVIFGRPFSNVVMFFIILATAATLVVAGHRNINSAPLSGINVSRLTVDGPGLATQQGSP